MVSVYQVGNFLDLVRQASNAKSNSRSLLIIQAKTVLETLDGMQLEDLAEEVQKLTEKEIKILLAVGIPKQIHKRVLITLQKVSETNAQR